MASTPRASAAAAGAAGGEAALLEREGNVGLSRASEELQEAEARHVAQIQALMMQVSCIILLCHTPLHRHGLCLCTEVV